MLKTPLVGQNHLLDLLRPDDLSSIEPHLKMFSMVRGAVLHESTSVIEHVYFPLSGLVSLVVVMSTGEQVETAIVGNDGVVGASLASFGPYSFCTQAAVQIPGMAWQLSSKYFLKLYHESANFQQIIDEFRSIVLIQTQQSVACNALHSVEARMCRWLLNARDVISSDHIQLTQEALSHMLGVQRTAVSLCATSLHERGLVEYSRGNIRILDRAGLEKYACECYEVIRAHVDRVVKSRRSTVLNTSSAQLGYDKSLCTRLRCTINQSPNLGSE